MKRRTPLVRIVGTIVDVEIGERPKGVREKLRPMSLQVSVTVDGQERQECLALGRALRLRVKELIPAVGQLIGWQFELFLNEDGQVEEFRRLPDYRG